MTLFNFPDVDSSMTNSKHSTRRERPNKINIKQASAFHDGVMRLPPPNMAKTVEQPHKGQPISTTQLAGYNKGTTRYKTNNIYSNQGSRFNEPI